MPVFQPGEETGEGAQAMIDDGLFTRFPKPEVILGQHVMVGPVGSVAAPGRSHQRETACRSACLGAVRMARCRRPASTLLSWRPPVLRLQTIVSREIAATDSAVVTVGSLQAGTKENVIPDEAIIKLNVRTFDEAVRKHVLAAIERIVNAEAEASGAPREPEISLLDRYALKCTTMPARKRVGGAFAVFPADRVQDTGPRRRAKTSAASARNGTSRRCSGSWAAPIPRFMPRPRPRVR